jgi:hypothetical protein
VAGGEVDDRRSTEYPRAMEVTIDIQRVDLEPWPLEYFPVTGTLAWGPQP